MKPVIFGISGPVLSDEERDALVDIQPAGIILFQRNVEDRAQLRALTADLRKALGRERPAILVDQEGGPVARLRPPNWPEFPPASTFSSLYVKAPMTAIEAARLNGEALGLSLAEVGISVNCAPLLDLCHPQTHASISTRSYGAEPAQTAALAKAMLLGMKAGGVTGVIKHMPGQGRATSDSHHDLPRVAATAEELKADLSAFKQLNNAPIGMTGHVLFETWDADQCVTHSAKLINEIIRKEIGFGGLLLSDDLHMDALTGSLPERAAAAINAGCDLALACHTSPADMRAIAGRLPETAPASMARLDAALDWPFTSYSVDKIAGLIDKRDGLLAYGN